jgi:hypothetical protein
VAIAVAPGAGEDNNREPHSTSAHGPIIRDGGLASTPRGAPRRASQARMNMAAAGPKNHRKVQTRPARTDRVSGGATNCAGAEKPAATVSRQRSLGRTPGGRYRYRGVNMDTHERRRSRG